jgi:fucose 4-O-acetylase-like acetyltransferase
MTVLSATAATPATIRTQRGRTAHLGYVDALRVMLIVLVIAHHSVEPYVSRNPPEWVLPGPPIPRAWVFLWVNACFFMGLFFFLAGYFMPDACARRGPGAFARERRRRLGVPLALGFLVIVPLEGWFRYRAAGLPAEGYRDYFVRDFLGFGSRPDGWPAGRRWPEMNLGHLWFLEHLLIYALLYALWRRFAPASPVPPARAAAPGNLAIAGYAVALTLSAVAIRHWYPIDRWVPFLGCIQMEPAHLPQYLSLLLIGLYAGPRRWIETMPRRRGLGWLAVGGGLAALAYLLIGSGVVAGGDPNGWLACGYESLLCVGFCVGLPVGLRELAIGTGRLWRTLGENVLAVYVFHFPIVMFLQWRLIGAPLPAWGRLIATVGLAVVATFLLTNYVVLRIPGSRRIF